MADNTTVTNKKTSFDADTNDDFDVATDDVSGIHYQRVKLDIGGDGVSSPVVSGNPLPTSGTISDIIPGTGATNLGKAVDDAAGATDTGVAMLAKHVEDQVHSTVADGDYELLSLDSLGSLHVNAEAHHVFDSMNATTGWTILGDSTGGLATTKKHVSGTDALTFNKISGSTVFAGIQKTLTSVDLGAVSPHDLLQGTFYIPVLTNVDYAFLRLGTDSSNYNEWRLPDDALTAAIFEVGALSIGDADYTGITGNGWDPSAITYIAVGVAYDSTSDTDTGIIFDEISYHTNQHSSAMINSEVSSSVSSANINMQKVGGSPTDKGQGNASNGSQRVVIADDDTNMAAILADTAAMDTNVATLAGAVSGTEMQVDIVSSTPGYTTWSTLPVQTIVSIGTSSTTLVAADASRTGLLVRNRTNSDIFVDLSNGTATTNDYKLDVKSQGFIISGANAERAYTAITNASSAKNVEVTEFYD